MQSFTGILLICHFVSDYYMQTSKIASEKVTSYKYTAIHSALYTIPFVLFLAIYCCVEVDKTIILIFFVAVSSHFLVDTVKYKWNIRTKGRFAKPLYVADQLVHVFILYGLAVICSDGITAFLIEVPYNVSARSVLLVLYILVIIQPSYISYKVLCSDDKVVRGIKEADNYLYKINGLLVGVAIYVQSYIILIAFLAAHCFIDLRYRRQNVTEAIKKIVFIVVYNLFVIYIIFYII